MLSSDPGVQCPGLLGTGRALLEACKSQLLPDISQSLNLQIIYDLPYFVRRYLSILQPTACVLVARYSF